MISIYEPLPLPVQDCFTHFTLPEAVSDPPLPVAVSVTVRFPFAVKVCVALTSLPVPPSPKLHEYDDTFVDPLALNVQLRDAQVYVKRATGAGVELLRVTGWVTVLVPLSSVTVSPIV